MVVLEEGQVPPEEVLLLMQEEQALQVKEIMEEAQPQLQIHMLRAEGEEELEELGHLIQVNRMEG
ncbi:hypothetical protein EB061_10070 [bacterium]|nr:hypothetical protein [bacterium]